MNYPTCTLVSDDMGNGVIVAVTDGRVDGLDGCLWSLHDPDGRMVGHGFSRAMPGAWLIAMKNGKAAAKRWLRRERWRFVAQAKPS